MLGGIFQNSPMGRNEHPMDYRNRINAAFRGGMQGQTIGGDVYPGNVERGLAGNEYGGLPGQQLEGDLASQGLTSAFGGKSKTSPHWKAWRRGTIPTRSNYHISKPTEYYYSGGSPDPDKMMMYPDQPWMWDRSGKQNYGGPSFGHARGQHDRMQRFLSGMGR